MHPALLNKNVSRETFLKLENYKDLLLKWNNTINLIGKTTEDDFWERHIIDSFQILHHIPSTHISLMDLGSGAGFPGMVLAIMAPHLKVTLVESNSKKCVFLREIGRILNVDVLICNKRIEEMPPVKSDIITARALAELNELHRYSLPFMHDDTLCFFIKGKNNEKEMGNVSVEQKALFSYVIIKSETQSEGVILQCGFKNRSTLCPQK